jgi:hypothetical protein
LGQLEVSSLEAIAGVEVEGSLYRVWQGQDFAPGQGLAVELTNLPQPSGWERLGRSVSGAGFWIVAIPVVLGAVLLAVLLYGGFGLRRPAIVDGLEVRSPTNGNWARRESLVREVAVLDEKFLRGQVPDAEYQAQRVQLKTRILAAARPSEGPELDRQLDPKLDPETR